MRKFVPGLLVFIAFAVLSFMLVLRDAKVEVAGDREPSSYDAISDTVHRIAREIENPEIFNPKSAPQYLNGLAAQAYQLNGFDFIPKGDAESKRFVSEANALANTMFGIRVRLGEKLGEFERSGRMDANETLAVVDAFRRAHLYLRYSEDYVIQWLNKVSPLESRNEFFKGDGPLTMLNPEFRESSGNFKYKSGDIILVRGASFFSATIARISDTPTNLSHSATVVETEAGELRVVEALLEKGMVSYPLATYLTLEHLPRAVIYRNVDPELARRSGAALWKFFQAQLQKPLPFDIVMDSADHSKVYCFETSSIAYELGSNGRERIPRYQSTMKQVVETDFAKQVGLNVDHLSAPADLDVDSRFRLVAEHRDPNMLDESRRYDVVVSKLFQLFRSGFTYKTDVSANLTAMTGIFARRFGMMKDKVPEGIKLDQFAALIRHKNLVNALMEQLGTAEQSELASRDGVPLSYRESEALFDKVCGTSCVKRKSVELNGRPVEEERGRGAAAGGRCDMLFRPAI
ncbi:hypothetical protein BH10BDE1_BH10BDE1_20230 [soil metagenome]